MVEVGRERGVIRPVGKGSEVVMIQPSYRSSSTTGNIRSKGCLGIYEACGDHVSESKKISRVETIVLPPLYCFQRKFALFDCISKIRRYR